MPDVLSLFESAALVGWTFTGALETLWYIALILIGFSMVIFVHELGHFAVAKWAGVRVEKFAIGFGKELLGFTRGETRYSLNVLPLGGYVKMLGQEDFAVDKSGEWTVKEDPRSFTSKPVGHRMAIVSAGVIMNVIFAAVLFMIVFMIGMDVPDSVVGNVTVGSQADIAGLRKGDRVLSIDGEPVDEFVDVNIAIMLADPNQPLNFTVERLGKTLEIPVTPKHDEEDNLLKIGIRNATTRKILAVNTQPEIPADQQLQPNDEIVRVGDITDPDSHTLEAAVLAARGGTVSVDVLRPDPNASDSPSKEVNCLRRGQLVLFPTGDSRSETGTLLGLLPRRKLTQVLPDSPAARAGFQAGDVILQWGSIEHPTFEECRDLILQSENRDIPVRVRRGETELELVVRPKAERKLLSKLDPTVGLGFDWPEEAQIVVAQTVEEIEGKPTPAASLEMPRGSRILAVNDESVQTWHELVERFRAMAGTTVSVTYQFGEGEPVTRQMAIPASITSSLKDREGNPVALPLSSYIIAVDGQTHVALAGPDGKPQSYAITFWKGLREALRQHIGREVEVRFTDYLRTSEQTAYMQVTADNIDPWQRRVLYTPGLVAMYPMLKPLQTSNPLTAMQLGAKKTWYFIANTYMTMKAMLWNRTVGVENVSGPVGIVKIGAEAAAAGIERLLYLLAILSANLAVINFLPLPIVDGGLMVFLIVEKLKGSPVSLKTQVVTQIIGLALIISAFVFVTVMDISKIFNG